jgi:predicted ATPase
MIDEDIKKTSARLMIKNIGNLAEADITIDKNCVIAGHNNIGKSTITKILFSIIKGINFGNKIYEDFINKIKNHNKEEQKLEIIKLIQKYNLYPYDKSIIFIKKLKHGLYLKYIYKYLNSTLGRNIIRFGKDEGNFTFKHNNFELMVAFVNKGIVQLEYKGTYEWFKDATLISSTEVLNYSNLISMADTSITEEFNNTKLVSAQDKDLIDKLNTEFIDMLDENFNIKEGLGFDKSGYAFYKENGNEIQMQMLGTGKKLFIMLDKLLKNKTISSDTLVMFDEPEEGMHPEWQLEFIEKLFEINVPFALTTHSPYIIQSLIYDTKKNIKEVKYYTVEQFENLGCAKSKEELKPLNIVKDLTNPILKVRGF